MLNHYFSKTKNDAQKWLSTIKCKQTNKKTKQNKLSYFVFPKQKHSSNNNNKLLLMSPIILFLSDLVQKIFTTFRCYSIIFSSIFLQLFLSSLKKMMTKKCSKKCYKKFQMHLKVAHRGMTLKTIPRKNRKRKKKLRVKLICLMTNANKELSLLSCICIIFIECHVILSKISSHYFSISKWHKTS